MNGSGIWSKRKMLISHVVVEELLQLLVDKVDGDLFEAVVLKDLKTGDVKHSTEVGLFLRKMSDKRVGNYLEEKTSQ